MALVIVRLPFPLTDTRENLELFGRGPQLYFHVMKGGGVPRASHFNLIVLPIILSIGPFTGPNLAIGLT